MKHQPIDQCSYLLASLSDWSNEDRPFTIKPYEGPTASRGMYLVSVGDSSHIIMGFSVEELMGAYIGIISDIRLKEELRYATPKKES